MLYIKEKKLFAKLVALLLIAVMVIAPASFAEAALQPTYEFVGGTQSFEGGYPDVTAYCLVDGPRQSEAYIADYFAEHPEVEATADELMHVLDDIKTFDVTWDGHEDGTFNTRTGEWYPEGEPKGFCVSFQQNDSLEDRYAAYDAKIYADLCAIAMNELGVDSVNIGWFSGAEISFCTESFEKAMKFAVEHNQHSIYDTIADTGIENIYYNPETNPIFD